ncbi:uncharacterized protein BO97DRAFT_345198 [Aspergillus homomorphus CBS 101889]|uniref:Uncharacterized protein n=1 Tax=Aspergillus homomorphus (strain CBS 101889) TaxID=1450537 RepID=A0A395I120_ASPHC|nr:hypothetical protein BO97DRAFT_345198 [Aspergillus homomorphus CBS 101889]RAL12234.1 hypothetical protein BO97DRAFT_345198 [Aspergillus homomorphus CBS 101889]
MQPNHYDLLGQVQHEDPRLNGRLTRDLHQSSRDHLLPHQSRSPATRGPTRSEDSWIEVSSQPSSSSLSSAGTNDDIITTGLRVQQQDPARYHRSRRRRLQQLAAITTAQVDYSSREHSSSQDEYEESESESDQVLSSSEDMTRPPERPHPFLVQTGPSPLPLDVPSDEGEDDDDNSTALGMRISPSPFVPQPNVFSHPPATQDPSWTRPTEQRHRAEPSEVSTSSRRTAIRARRDSQASIRSTRRSSYQHSPYNMISPSHHADHDAALRASLSTLLSCAAAARGLPKSDAQPTQSGPSRAPAPSSFRLVSESVAMGEICEEEATGADPAEATRSPRSRPSPPPYSPRSIPSAPPRAKRRSSPSKERSHSAKKTRRGSTVDPIGTASPTIMTWVISAGVVVLFSAISFSAGYVLGREVGRLEASTGIGAINDGPGGRVATGCGQEAVRGSLKRFRWGTGTSASGIMA